MPTRGVAHSQTLLYYTFWKPLTEGSLFCRTPLSYIRRLIFLAGTIRTFSLDKSIQLMVAGRGTNAAVERYSLDRGSVGAYRQRTLVGTPGASHFSQVIHRRANAASRHPARSLRVQGRGASFPHVAPRGPPERESRRTSLC